MRIPKWLRALPPPGVLAMAAPLLLGPGLPVLAGAAPFEITRWTVDGGGATAVAAGPYVFGGTAGQPDAGRLPRLSYVLGGGFWGTLAPAVTGVADSLGEAPDPLPAGPSGVREARIFAPAPNPILHRTRIAFELPHEERVEIQIFGLDGGLVRTLADGPHSPGRHVLDWDVRDAAGQRVGPGIYVVRVRVGPLQKSLKLVVMQ